MLAAVSTPARPQPNTRQTHQSFDGHRVSVGLCSVVARAGTRPASASSVGSQEPPRFDEFAPGNKLRIDNNRKCFVLSFTFLELETVDSESCWFTPVVVRSVMVHRCQGGWPAFLKTYIRTHLLGNLGIAAAGVALLLDGSPHVLFARVSNLLTDGDGHRVSWDWKGQGSMKPCIKHVNVLRKGSELAHRHPGFVEITHAVHTDFRHWTTADACDCMTALSVAQERVRDGRVTSATKKDLEMATGLLYRRVRVGCYLRFQRSPAFSERSGLAKITLSLAVSLQCCRFERQPSWRSGGQGACHPCRRDQRHHVRLGAQHVARGHVFS